MYNAYKSILDRRIDEHKQLARNAWSALSKSPEQDVLFHIMEYEQNKAIVNTLSSLRKEYGQL